jgi:hypothetical protein
LEGGVGGKAHVFDGRELRLVVREQQHFCAAERGVAGGVDDRVRRFEEADAESAVDLHVVAEGAGQMDDVERVRSLRG